MPGDLPDIENQPFREKQLLMDAPPDGRSLDRSQGRALIADCLTL